MVQVDDNILLAIANHHEKASFLLLCAVTDQSRYTRIDSFLRHLVFPAAAHTGLQGRKVLSGIEASRGRIGSVFAQAGFELCILGQHRWDLRANGEVLEILKC